jgi:hypothetical protein
MDIRQFWKLIGSARKKARGDRDALFDALYEKLKALPVEEVVSFEEHMMACLRRAYRYDLWAAATVIDGFWVSDDAFHDFRSWLISRGEKVFEKALADPDSLARIVGEDEDIEFERFAFVAGGVWEEKTGKSMQYMLPDDFPLPSKPEGEPPGDEEIKRRFPKLWARFQDEEDD